MIKYSFWHFNFWPRLLLRNYLMAIFIYLQYITSWLVGGYYWHLFPIFKQLICPKGWRSLDFEYNWNWNVWSLLDMEGCGIKSTLGISYWDWVVNDKFYSMILVLGNSYYYNLVVTKIWVYFLNWVSWVIAIFYMAGKLVTLSVIFKYKYHKWVLLA